MAAIGTVNPRAGGPLNWMAQQAKKTIARALDWHVREQVEFNRNVMVCVEATLEALEDTRRILAGFGEGQPGAERHPLPLGGLAPGVGTQAGGQRDQAAARPGGIEWGVPASRGTNRELLPRPGQNAARRFYDRSRAQRLGHSEAPVGGSGADPPGIRASDSRGAAGDPAARGGGRTRRLRWRARPPRIAGRCLSVSTTAGLRSAFAAQRSMSGAASDSTCRTFRGGKRCWISVAGAANFWN